ncbi:MAG TPA: hypothetical protein VF054_08955 [Micromonosporaceae bacterium]
MRATAGTGTTRTWWDNKLLAEWVAANALAYLVVVVGGVALEQLFAGTARSLAGTHRLLATLAIALIGASFHGLVLGRWQWLVLRQRLPHLHRRRWTTATFVPALAVWLLVLAPDALDVITRGGNEITVFRDAFVQALVLGPLIGLAQATALRHDTTRWKWWFVANLTSYLFAAAMYEVGRIVLAGVPSGSRFSPAFPLLAFVFHGIWMPWVTDPATRIRPRATTSVSVPPTP